MILLIFYLMKLMQFKKDHITLLLANSEEYIKTVPNKFYDLVFCDPPYGLDMSKNAGLSTKYKKKKWDKKPPSKDFLTEIQRISKYQIIFGANHFIENIPNASGPGWFLWDKRENIIPERTFADGELAFTNYDKPLRIFRHYWDGFLKKSKQDRIHPTEKPIKLYDWILKNYASPGFKILDTHGGSFASAISCFYYDCSYLGIELDPDYYSDGVKRFDLLTAQKKIIF